MEQKPLLYGNPQEESLGIMRVWPREDVDTLKKKKKTPADGIILAHKIHKCWIREQHKEKNIVDVGESGKKRYRKVFGVPVHIE